MLYATCYMLVEAGSLCNCNMVVGQVGRVEKLDPTGNDPSVGFIKCWGVRSPKSGRPRLCE
jgi:hypothetical protein